MKDEKGPESRQGWNGTFVFEGDTVRVRKPGFGRNCQAVVVKLGPAGCVSMCEVELTKVGKTGAGWVAGNRVSIAGMFLEGVRF